ncbi:MAG: hypothetical protein KJ697_01525 [Nanoarchaeota archaeon]|nr:hypothetical protein [Nanoarchaeota archaeon]MBU4124512.1 hypothetical protein [Nanoarchaeota archaeon]
MAKKITMDWSKISLLSLIVFLVGWKLFGFFDAVLIAIIVLALAGILKFK